MAVLFGSSAVFFDRGGLVGESGVIGVGIYTP